MPHIIGTVKEYSLHADIKNWYRETSDLVESVVDGFVIDIVRGNQLIEIQTGHFYALKNKLSTLLTHHPIRVVYPIPVLKWVTRYDVLENRLLVRRRSPKKGKVQSIFDELVYLPIHILHDNLEIEVLLIEQEDIWYNDGKGSWRRRFWSVEDRRLNAILERRIFEYPDDYLALLPDGLPDRFSSQEVSKMGGGSRDIARKMLYCLSKMKMIKHVCTLGNSKYYSREI